MRELLERRYGELRRQSIYYMANQALRTPDIRISTVDSTAYVAFEQWRHHPAGVVDWD
jgi:hypothetical protein